MDKVSASALERAASVVRRAARSTTRDTSEAMTTNTISARTLAGLAMVKV